MTEPPDPLPPFWPRPNRFLESLRAERSPQTFMWMTLASPEVVEMAGALGLDCAVIDMEHTSSGLEQVQQLVTVAQGAGMTALVRVETPTADIGRILDLGAQGIVFPRIATKEQARAAAAAMQYPPRGDRGWSGAHARSVRWAGTNADGTTDARLFRAENLAAADDALVRIFMIEDEDGAAAIEDILDAGQPHGVIFGWGDCSVSVGFDADRVSKARRTVIESCRRRSIGVAISVVPPDTTEFYPGCFFSAGVDSTLLSSALVTRLSAARAAGASAT
jgi:4-hydroxy-2-oxoheptanedioate aldolase